MAERRRKLLELRAAGVSTETIVGMAEFAEAYHGSTARAIQDVRRALEARAAEIKVLADHQIAEELGRLAGLERRAHDVLRKAAAANDHVNTLRAVAELRRISERRSALLGLDQVSAQANKDSGGKPGGQTDEVARKRARRRAAVKRAAG